MVINKNTNKMQKLVEVHFVRMAFVKVLFVGTVFVYTIISSHLIIESSIILHTYLPFL